MSADDNRRVPNQQSGDETSPDRQAMLRQLRDVNERLVVSFHARAGLGGPG